jgi:hypothetical protein
LAGYSAFGAAPDIAADDEGDSSADDSRECGHHVLLSLLLVLLLLLVDLLLLLLLLLLLQVKKVTLHDVRRLGEKAPTVSVLVEPPALFLAVELCSVQLCTIQPFCAICS